MDKFQYYLTDEDGKFYYVENGAVKLSVEPIPLPQSPSGWQDLLIGWERDLTKYGIIRNFSLPLGFVLDGAKIIRHLFYNSNIEKEIHLVITKYKVDYKATTFKEYYYKFYEGELDLSTLKDELTRVTVNIAETGYVKKLKANAATPFEIPFDQDKIRVKMDGIYLYQKFNYIVQAGSSVRTHVLGTLEAAMEGGGAGLAHFTSYLTQVGNNYQDVDFAQRLEYFLAATQDISNVRIKGTLKFTAYGSTSVYLVNSNNEVVYTLAQFTYNGTPLSTTKSFDITIDVEKGLNYFLVGQSAFTVVYEETTFTVDFKSKFGTTYIYAYKPLDYYKKLVVKVLGANVGTSDLLSDNANYCITCGDAVRGLDGAKIKFSYNNFFEAYNTVLNAGASIEDNQLLFESKDRYFDTSNPIDLGEVKDLKFSVATDLISNTEKIGYPVQQIDDVNGKSSFNNTHIYTTPVTRVVKEVALIAPVVTDPFAIENYRLNLDGKTTTDDSTDNEVILLDVDLDDPQTDSLGTYYNLKRETYTSISGLPDPDTTFNIRFSPKTLMFTHQRGFDSVFYGFENADLEFQTTEKNASLTRTIGGTTIDEDSDFTITGNPYFLPFYMEFDTQVPIDLATILGVDQNRCFQFEWKGYTWEGFLIKAGIAPNDNKAQAFKVLLTPNNDLTKLI